MKRSLAALSIGLAMAVSGLTVQAQDPPSPPNFLNLVTVGDSLAAGFISGVLVEHGQFRAFPTLIAGQVGTFHFSPFMPAPGVGQEITLVDGNLVIGPLTGGTTSRGFPLIVPQNLAIPGQDVGDALTRRPDFGDPSKPFENLILGVPITAIFGRAPVSQIELAVGLQPTFTLVWLGSNDVFGVATSGREATSIAAFQVAYQTAIGALLTLTNTKLIVATVPDVTVIPFITSAEEVAAAVGAPLALIGPALGIGAGDFVRPGGAGLVQPILTGQVAGPIPESEILRAAKVAETRVLVATMNGFHQCFRGPGRFSGCRHQRHSVRDRYEWVSTQQRPGVDDRSSGRDLQSGWRSSDVHRPGHHCECLHSADQRVLGASDSRSRRECHSSNRSTGVSGNGSGDALSLPADGGFASHYACGEDLWLAGRVGRNRTLRSGPGSGVPRGDQRTGL